MQDVELKRWGAHGRNLTKSTPVLNGFDTSEDVFQLWKVVGELEKQVRDLRKEIKRRD